MGIIISMNIRKCLTIAAALAVIFWQTGCKPASESERKDAMIPEIKYTFNTTDELMPTEFMISLEGLCTLNARSNRGASKHYSVGTYMIKLNEEQLKPLVNLLRSNDFFEIQNPKSLTEGEIIRRLEVKEINGNIVRKIANESSSAHPVFQTAEKLIQDLIQITQNNPLQAITIEIAQMPSGFAGGETVSFSLVLTNIGTNTLQIPHPEKWPEQSVQIQLQAIRSDIPLTELRSRHQKFEVFLLEAIDEITGGLLQGAFIKLNPTDKLTLKLHKKLDWDKGEYDAVFSCMLPLLNTEGKEIIRCEIISKNFKLKCL